MLAAFFLKSPPHEHYRSRPFDYLPRQNCDKTNTREQIAKAPRPMKPADTRPPTKWHVLASGVLTLILVMGIARFSFTPMLSYMKTGAGVGEALGGWLAGWNYFGYLSGVIIIPFIKCHETREKLFGASLLAAVISTAAMGMVENTAIWCAARYISGLSTAGGFIIASGMMLNWLSHNNGKQELGLMYSGLGFGITLSAILVELASPFMSWAGQWYVLAVVGLLLVIPAWAWRPKATPTIASALEEAELTNPAPATPQPGRTWFLLLQLAYLFSGFAFVVYATFIVIIIEAEPALQNLSVWLWALLGLVAAFSTFIFDLVARKLGFLRALALAFALKAIALTLVAFTTNIYAAILSAVLFGLTFVSIVSLAMNLAGQRFPQNPARYMAVLSVSYGTAQVIGPILSGQFAESSGSFSTPLLVCTALLLAGIICLETMKQMQNRIARKANST